MSDANGTDLDSKYDNETLAESVGTDPNTEQLPVDSNGDGDEAPAGEEKNTKDDPDVLYPYQVKVDNLPEMCNIDGFQSMVENMVKFLVPHIKFREVNRSTITLCFAEKWQQVEVCRFLKFTVWKRNIMKITPLSPLDSSEATKESDDEPVKNYSDLTPQEELIAQTLPFLEVPYEEQIPLVQREAFLLSERFHRELCHENPELAGWAEASIELNDGTLFRQEPAKFFKIEETKGYRSKGKFRISDNKDGETVVGLGLGDSSTTLVEVFPGDKLIQYSDSMKLAVQKFQAFIRSTKYGAHNKRDKSGVWNSIQVRVTPEDEVMLIPIINDAALKNSEIAKLKEDMVNYFTTGDGAVSKVISLYLQYYSDSQKMCSLDKLTLLMGKANYEEEVCGFRFPTGPYSIKIYSPTISQHLYDSVVELAELTPETVVIDACAGSGGISFVCAKVCEKAYAVEPEEDYLRDAKMTIEMNDITGVELLKGKAEDEVKKILAKIDDDKSVVVVIDPPPGFGLPVTLMASLRSSAKVKKIIYVQSSKISNQNFYELCWPAGTHKDTKLEGLPFLPTRVVPIDLAPFTISNICVVLLERVDPSTYPKPTKPPPKLRIPRKTISRTVIRQRIQREKDMRRKGYSNIVEGRRRGAPLSDEMRAAAREKRLEEREREERAFREGYQAALRGRKSMPGMSEPMFNDDYYDDGYGYGGRRRGGPRDYESGGWGRGPRGGPRGFDSEEWEGPMGGRRGGPGRGGFKRGPRDFDSDDWEGPKRGRGASDWGNRGGYDQRNNAGGFNQGGQSAWNWQSWYPGYGGAVQGGYGNQGGYGMGYGGYAGAYGYGGGYAMNQSAGYGGANSQAAYGSAGYGAAAGGTAGSAGSMNSGAVAGWDRDSASKAPVRYPSNYGSASGYGNAGTAAPGGATQGTQGSTGGTGW